MIRPRKNYLKREHGGKKILRGPSGDLTLMSADYSEDFRLSFAFNRTNKNGTEVRISSTGTSAGRYQFFLDEICSEVTPETQVIEIGGGFSGFSPALSEYMRKKFQTFKRPIVIDPLNYNNFLFMARRFIERYASGAVERRILYSAIRNVKAVLNPKRINLINTTLGEALHNYPELAGSADFVVDNCGLVEYPKTEFPDVGNWNARYNKVYALELKLTKPERRRLFINGSDNERVMADLNI